MPPHGHRRAQVITFSIHAIVFVILAWGSWRKWPDPLIDFGRELYVPWQITQGAVLHRDIASLFGPLSPYVNALWFRVFGVSLTTLIFCNLAIFAAMLAGLYHLVRLTADRLAATLATLSVMLLFGFSQYVAVGNYNFVTPYSHEATHGLALSVALMVALHHGFVRRRLTLFAMAGLCFGGVLLTKPETSLAAAAAAATGLAAALIADGGDRRRIATSIAVFLVGVTVPALAFFAYFGRHMPAAAAGHAIASAWTAAIGSAVVANDFYRGITGFDAPAANLLRMLRMFAGFAAFAGAGALIAVRTGTPSPGTPVAPAWRIARLAFLGAVILLVPLSGLPGALPLMVLTAMAAFAIEFMRRLGDRASALGMVPMLMLSAFALILLAKMVLNARLFHYGFYLALPAVTVTIVFLVWLVPEWLDSWSAPGAGQRFRVMAILALAAAVVPYPGLSYVRYRSKTIAIGSAGDRFYASDAPGLWQGAAVRDALARIQELSPSGSTMTVLPEGVMLNYLARRRSPVRVVNLMPPELLTFGEPEVLRSLQAAPPELMLFVHRDVTEYGYPLFGTDQKYGRAIVLWVRAHYDTVQTVGGGRPGDEAGAGIEILKRRSPTGE
jgi:hypothetical protein